MPSIFGPLRHGDTRESDGFRFIGYKLRAGERYERWTSPTAWDNLKKGYERRAQDRYSNVKNNDTEKLRRWRNMSAKAQERTRLHNVPKSLLNKAKSRAKRFGLEINIDVSDIVVPEFCPVFGFKLEVATGGSAKPNSPSLDRIDNDKGYVKGNVVVVSHLANSMKRNATVGQLRRLADFYESLTDGYLVEI